jgi:hypothetical protein
VFHEQSPRRPVLKAVYSSVVSELLDRYARSTAAPLLIAQHAGPAARESLPSRV